MAYDRFDHLAIPEGATIEGRLEKLWSVAELLEQGNWRVTYADCCLKADLTAARGTMRLRSIVYVGVCCFASKENADELAETRPRRFDPINMFRHPSFHARDLGRVVDTRS